MGMRGFTKYSTADSGNQSYGWLINGNDGNARSERLGPSGNYQVTGVWSSRDTTPMLMMARIV